MHRRTGGARFSCLHRRRRKKLSEFEYLSIFARIIIDQSSKDSDVVCNVCIDN